jgi:hypothetical protein
LGVIWRGGYRDKERGLAPLLRSVVVRLEVVKSVILDANSEVTSARAPTS